MWNGMLFGPMTFSLDQRGTDSRIIVFSPRVAKGHAGCREKDGKRKRERGKDVASSSIQRRRDFDGSAVCGNEVWADETAVHVISICLLFVLLLLSLDFEMETRKSTLRD